MSCQSNFWFLQFPHRMTVPDSLIGCAQLFVLELRICSCDCRFGSIWTTCRCIFRARCVVDLNCTWFRVAAKILSVCFAAFQIRISHCCIRFPAINVSNFPEFRSCIHVIGEQLKSVGFLSSIYLLVLMFWVAFRYSFSRMFCLLRWGGGILLSVDSHGNGVEFTAPVITRMELFSSVSIFLAWTLFSNEEQQYAAAEYTIAMAVILKQWAGAPQDDPASFRNRLFRVKVSRFESERSVECHS